MQEYRGIVRDFHRNSTFYFSELGFKRFDIDRYWRSLIRFVGIRVKPMMLVDLLHHSLKSDLLCENQVCTALFFLFQGSQALLHMIRPA